MSESIYKIPFSNLIIVIIPVVVVMVIYARWLLKGRSILYAFFRMASQLVVVGYVLAFVFFRQHVAMTCFILALMVFVASWIALRPLASKTRELYWNVLVSLAAGGGAVLVLVIGGVIRLEPWYLPRYIIPLAGMIFAGSMNSVSLCAERFEAEIDSGASYCHARNIAYKTALIPILNMYFAVGIVSIPGMMTGQILAGISPLIAVRYQIMVMCMLLGASGISSAVYLVLQKQKKQGPGSGGKEKAKSKTKKHKPQRAQRKARL